MSSSRHGALAFRGGWHTGARIVPSPNRGARPDGAIVDLVVIHSISLPPGEYGAGHIEQLFINSLGWDGHPYFQQIRGTQVSAHFVILRTGELMQFVSCDERAWHAGRSSFQGRDNCNDFSIGIELEGLEGEAFAPSQYRSLVQLLAGLRACYPIEHVVGHEHVAPGRKQDPGAGFDWQGLALELAWPARCFPSMTVR